MSRRVAAFFVACLLAFSAAALAEKVRYVIDGDTLILATNERVRLIGINAPEIPHRRYGKRGQAFGQKSREYLARLVDKKDVDLRPGAEPFDRFGRRLAYVYLKDGTFVNRRMVEEGYAEVFRKFPFEHRKEFLELEARARAARRGMWSGRRSVWDRISDWLENAGIEG